MVKHIRQRQFFILGWNKQVSQVAAIILDQTTILKRKISRPRSGKDEAQGLEQGLCAMERDLLVLEMGAK